MDIHGNASRASPHWDTTFDWKPDIARLQGELEAAERRGAVDELALAEMECSLDLIDAELLNLRSRRQVSQDHAIRELSELRAKLVRSIGRMQRLTRT